MELAEVFERTLGEEVKGVELFTKRRFSLVVFRVLPLPSSSTTSPSSSSDKLELEQANTLTRTLTTLAAADHSLMLTPTTVGGTECVRVAVGSGFTEERHVRGLVGRLQVLIGQAREAVEKEGEVNGGK